MHKLACSTHGSFIAIGQLKKPEKNLESWGMCQKALLKKLVFMIRLRIFFFDEAK